MLKINALLFSHGRSINILCVFLSILNHIKMNKLRKWIHQRQVQRGPEAAQQKATYCFAEVSLYMPLLQFPPCIASKSVEALLGRQLHLTSDGDP